MNLEEYSKKRDFEETSEPEGQERHTQQSSGENIYVIQKHHAKRLHYDLRLEMDGVLKSWAVPKTPPLEKGVKRLAIQVEDHPLEYASFEGTIPQGQYGAGTVEIWDKGHYVMKDKSEDLIVVEIRGHQLQGEYCLVRFKTRYNWLFFKKK